MQNIEKNVYKIEKRKICTKQKREKYVQNRKEMEQKLKQELGYLHRTDHACLLGAAKLLGGGKGGTLHGHPGAMLMPSSSSSSTNSRGLASSVDLGEGRPSGHLEQPGSQASPNLARRGRGWASLGGWEGANPGSPHPPLLQPQSCGWREVPWEASNPPCVDPGGPGALHRAGWRPVTRTGHEGSGQLGRMGLPGKAPGVLRAGVGASWGPAKWLGERWP